GAPGLLGDTAKAESALAKAGDGKFKTNAIRFPTNFESLENYLQSISRKMNIRITKRSPILATDRGHYKFHDPGPDVPHSKGSGAKISPERQKQIDALESGEYSGKGNKGTGKNVFSYTADFEDHIINVQGIVRKKNKGVVGGHNRENFEKAFTDEGWNLEDCIIYERKHPYIDGITETKYGIPALDREGNIIVGELKSIPKPKTVYDPQKISDADIIKWGKEAMENGKVDGRVVRGSSSNGLEFEGYIDETTGKVTNVFPIVPRNE
ncbi:CdiA family toxin C-terminal domain-containing protein, partial [Paenibacillus sp. NRS-1781]|uniref:CdiA family toxin C-terminal domain-containing protein n=1 Tax=Paenibacillus sp. NRS-1781 TaxID=3233905 RepID=UPI003D278FFC